MKQLLSINQIAKHFGVHRATIYNWINKLGMPYELSPSGTRRFDLEKIIEWNDKRK